MYSKYQLMQLITFLLVWISILFSRVCPLCRGDVCRSDAPIRKVSWFCLLRMQLLTEKSGAPGMVLWSNSDRTCKTSVGVIFISPPLLVRTAQDALYSTENSHRSHPIMKLMTCYGEFRILVWWGEFVDIGLLASVSLYRCDIWTKWGDWCRVQPLDNCQIYWFHVFPICTGD